MIERQEIATSRVRLGLVMLGEKVKDFNHSTEDRV